MDNDEQMDSGKGPEKLVKICVFTIVAIIIVTTIAIPILTSIGERTHTEYNEGVRMNVLTPEKWETLTERYDTAPKLWMTGIGLYISGQIDGNTEFTYLVHIEDYDTQIPIAFASIHPVPDYTNERMYSFDPSTNKYTIVSSTQTSVSSSVQLNPPISQEENTQEIWYQDPAGPYIMNTGGMKILSDSDVFGLHISQGSCLISDLEQAKYFTGLTPSYGTPTVDRVEHNGYSTIESISYSGTDCSYYIGPYTFTWSENVLSGTTIGSLIGMIPLLMIIGIVMYVLRSSKLSDR